MKHVLGLSIDPDRVQSPTRLVIAAREAFEQIHGQKPDEFAGETEFLFVSGTTDDDLWNPTIGKVAIFLTRGCYTTSGERVDAKSFIGRMRGGPRSTVSSISPPFGAVAMTGPDMPIEAVTDTYGLRHVFYDSGDGWAAVGSTVATIARLGARQPDTRSVGALALLGYLLEDETVFDRVARLPAATACSLRRGQISLSRDREATIEASRADGRGGSASGAEMLSGRLAACLDAYDDVTLELSGGIDSRAVLAAIPAARRARMHAITLGDGETADVKIARALAQQCSLDHQVVDLSGLRAMDAAEARMRVEDAAQRADMSSTPVVDAAISWVEGQVDQRPRLTGQGGEIARGFYYPGIWNRFGARSSRAARMSRWRLFTVDVVDAGLFAPGAWEAIRDQTTKTVQRIFAELDDTWLEATDEFYLDQRMRNWVGSRYSSASLDRRILAPFFHPQFVAWARATGRREKAGSRAVAGTIVRLDGQLGSVPLDHGESPATLAEGGVPLRIREGRRYARKAVNKARQRFSRAGRAPEVGAVLADLVVRSWSEDPDALGHLEEFDLLDHAQVRAFASGQRRASPATVGFLVNLDILSRVRHERGDR